MNLINKCQCCGKDNGWALLDPEYADVCGECEADTSNPIGFFEGRYQLMATCGCGAKGPVNYEKDQYYCGKGPSCCP